MPRTVPRGLLMAMLALLTKLSSSALQAPLRFYLYDITRGPLFQTTRCKSTRQYNAHYANGYWQAQHMFVSALSNTTFTGHSIEHGVQRVAAPEDAQIFVIDFDVDFNHELGECKMKSHKQWGKNTSLPVERLSVYIETLRKHPVFINHQLKGTLFTHVWMIHSWKLVGGRESFFGYDLQLQSHFSEMTVLRYQLARDDRSRYTAAKQRVPSLTSIETQFHFATMDDADYSCVVGSPILAKNGLIVQGEDLEFRTWQARRIQVHYRGRGHQLYHGSSLRERAATLLEDMGIGTYDDRWVVRNEYAKTPKMFQSELKMAKYCLVLRSDDPQTSRFVESLAAGCVPVVINDMFHAHVAYFPTRVRYHAFVIFIPEQLFMRAPREMITHHVLSQTPQEEARRLRALAVAQKQLLWNVQDSKTAELLLLEAFETCVAKRAAGSVGAASFKEKRVSPTMGM